GGRPKLVSGARTGGARRPPARQGPASTGETFQNEITVFLRDFQVSKATAVEIADPVVSTVRVLPEATGTTVVVFIRQPVTYTVSRPSGIGDVVISLQTRKPAPSAAPAIGPTGRMRAPTVGAGQRGKEGPTQGIQIDGEGGSHGQEEDNPNRRGRLTARARHAA